MKPLKYITLLCSALGLMSVSCDKSQKIQSTDFARLRKDMVTYQIEYRGIKDTDLLRAMRKVERHLFIPEEEISSAYEDRPVPIGYGQTISQPYIVAYMTELIHSGKCSKVLEIGTGSAYQAAILAEIVDSVFTVEIIPELGASASERLRKLGCINTYTKIGDGYFGWEEHAPYDAILVTAASEFIPPPLLSQLAEGGRMVIPVGSPFMVQWLMLVEKINGKIVTSNLMPVRFVPLRRN